MSETSTEKRTTVKRAARTANRSRQERINEAKADHYRRLAEINAELDHVIGLARGVAQEKRRGEHARHRTAMEKARQT